MGDRLPAVRTQLTRDGLVNGLLVAWPADLTPKRAQVKLAAAQIDAETGLALCYCYNLGNAKGRPNDPKRCHTFYRCGEEMSAPSAEVMVKSDDRATIVKRYDKGGKPWASVRFEPDHPWSCFRAFRSLPEAMTDHLEMLRHRQPWWDGLLTGEPVTYAAALVGIPGAPYYTADPKKYTKLLIERLAKFDRPGEVREITWGDVV